MTNPPKVFNGLKLHDNVRAMDNDGELSVREIRKIGPAGFLVVGLSTCFKWEEEGCNWEGGSKWERL
jgi:hypothetical protein